MPRALSARSANRWNGLAVAVQDPPAAVHDRDLACPSAPVEGRRRREGDLHPARAGPDHDDPRRPSPIPMRESVEPLLEPAHAVQRLDPLRVARPPARPSPPAANRC